MYSDKSQRNSHFIDCIYVVTVLRHIHIYTYISLYSNIFRHIHIYTYISMCSDKSHRNSHCMFIH